MTAAPTTGPAPGAARSGRAPRAGRRLGPATTGAAVGAALLAAAAVYPHLPETGALCPMRRITGIPCPGCGMTTGVVATVRGHVLDGFAANPVAPLVVLLAAVVVVWRVAAWVARRDPGPGPVARLGRLRVHPALLLPVVGLLWVYELHRFGHL